MFYRALTAMAAMVWPVAAAAELCDYCPDRPGIGTPSCTIDAGHFSVELGLGDSTRVRNADEHSDQLLLGDVLVRYGIADHTEVQLGWAGAGSVSGRIAPCRQRRGQPGAAPAMSGWRSGATSGTPMGPGCR